MAVKSSELMLTLLANLQQVLTGKDEDSPVASDENTFITWLRAGIVYDPADFNFGASPDDGASEVDSSAKETEQLKRQFEWAKLVNAIPKVSPVYDVDQSQLDKVFDMILKQSQVVDNPISEADLAKIAKYRDLLNPKEVSYTNLLGDQKTRIEYSPIMTAYDSCMTEYENALTDFTRLRISAQNGVKGAAKEFAAVGSILKKKVTNAREKWANDGYREEVDGMRAFIEQVTSRSLVLWKQGLVNNIEMSRTTDLDSSDTYLWTSFLPGNFAKRSSGWTKFQFGSSEFSSSQKAATDTWGASGGANWGLWSASASTSGTSTRTENNSNLNDFQISFQIAQIPIVRPWFDPTFLKSRAWRLTAGGKASLGDMASSGGSNPNGFLPAYTTFAIFVKDVTLNMKNENGSDAFSALTTESSASVGWGPFKVRGNYNNSRSDRSIKTNASGGGISVEGMQLIGFKCMKLNYKSPNPHPEITENQWK
ncbi:MAG: hypothetical protein ACO1G9_04035 [Bacteroidota bacterium]